MKILWAGNYQSQSSYANQGRLIVPRLRALGHEVTVLSLGSGSNLPQMVGDVMTLPTGVDPLGNDIINAHVDRLGAQAVISMIDAWGLNGELWGKVPWYPYTPVDHMPIPPAVVESVQHAVRPIAMARYGESQLRQAGFDPYYAPLVYDPAIWQPGDKLTARHSVGWQQEPFVVAFVGVNDSCPSRKGIPELLTAWSIFVKERPKSLLYMHTSMQGNGGSTNGVKIDALIRALGIPAGTVQVTDQYRYRTGIPQRELAAVARAADLLLLPSRGEGFGLPLIEFQAVGCPVATTAFAAQDELVFGGWKIEGEPEWSWQSAFVQKPGVASMVEVLLEAYDDRDNPKRRQEAIDGARPYAVDNVIMTYWPGILRNMAERWLEGVK